MCKLINGFDNGFIERGGGDDLTPYRVKENKIVLQVLPSAEMPVFIGISQVQDRAKWCYHGATDLAPKKHLWKILTSILPILEIHFAYRRKVFCV